MSASKSSITVAARNRCNALKSTGPRTPEGKAIARRNAIKHGLTAADPTAVGPEEGSLFKMMHEQLVEELAPRGMIEEHLVHRIAVSLWRLRRAALIDGAYSNQRVDRVPRSHERTQRCIDDFNRLWVWQEVQEGDREKVKWARSKRLIGADEKEWVRLKRRRLWQLERLREEMMEEAEGVWALQVMLADLREKCRRRFQERVLDEDIEKLAFIMGDHSETFRIHGNEMRHKGGIEYAEIEELIPEEGPMQELIRKGLPKQDDHGLSEELDSALRACDDTLDQQRQVLESPLDAEDQDRREKLALLPSAKFLERVMRYETHAERSLYRALEQLARMRGVTVQILAARLSVAPAADDS